MSAPVLVIAEKPSLGRTICSALGGQMGKPFVFNGETLIVVAAAGHLIEMLDPEGHDAKWGGDWNHASLPIIPTKLKYKPRDRRAAETLKGFKDLVAEHGITEAISAGDAAREGSHIVALIWSRYLNQPMANCRRAWFHSLTPEALRDAFTNLKAPEFDVGLAAAAECRSRADYVLGMSASRAASIQLRAKGGISVGRVQTPTLAFVVDADRQRLGHTAGVYYKVTGTALDIDVEWREALGSDVDRFDTRPPADAVAAATAGHGTVAAFDAKTTSHKAPHLFDLTALQRTANTAFSWTATRTLEVAQGLYERGILSYPRSDSAFLPSDMADEFHTWVTANLPKGASADMVDVSVVCDDSKVSDHYAIVPAGPGAGLNGDDKKLFDLVAKRCAAACLPAHTVDRQVLWVEANGHFFRGALARTATPGWTLAEGNRATDTLIAVPAVGSPAPLADVAVTEGTAKTPPKMTEARLLKLMTTAGRDLDDDELVAAMGESGIGTPATRANIIEGLVARGYLKRTTKHLEATAKAHGFITAIESDDATVMLRSAELTGRWEKTLRDLEQVRCFDTAAATAAAFDAEIDAYVTDLMPALARLTANAFYAASEAIGADPCPVADCSGHVVVVADRGFAKCSTNRSKDEQGCGSFLWAGKKADGKPRKLTQKALAAWLARPTA